jgi:hypothetical protein
VDAVADDGVRLEFGPADSLDAAGVVSGCGGDGGAGGDVRSVFGAGAGVSADGVGRGLDRAAEARSHGSRRTLALKGTRIKPT